jgi:hypothetical protein
MSSTSYCLFAADLSAVLDLWKRRAFDPIVAANRRGRLAAVLSAKAAGVDGQRALFDALVEDIASARLWDAPANALAEVFSALARIAKRKELELAALDGRAPFAYPPELLDEPSVEHAGGHAGLVVWLHEPGQVKAAQAALEGALELPVGAFPAADPALWRDLCEALAPVLDAATRPGGALLALRQ